MFDWFLIFNTSDFTTFEFISKSYTLNLDGIGVKTILVTKGENFGLTYEGVFLQLGLNDENPFKFEGYAVYLNNETNDVYLGIEVAGEG